MSIADLLKINSLEERIKELEAEKPIIMFNHSLELLDECELPILTDPADMFINNGFGFQRGRVMIKKEGFYRVEVKSDTSGKCKASVFLVSITGANHYVRTSLGIMKNKSDSRAQWCAWDMNKYYVDEMIYIEIHNLGKPFYISDFDIIVEYKCPL
jgi:hypothetical protein